MDLLRAAIELYDSDLVDVSDYARSCPFCGGDMIRGDPVADDRWHLGFEHYDECPWTALPAIIEVLTGMNHE